MTPNALISRRLLLQRAAGGSALFLVPSLLAACGGGDDPKQAGAASGESYPLLRVALQTDFQSLDIVTASFSAGSVTALCQQSDRLIGLDATDGSPVPGIATQWSIENGTTYTFTIRDGVKFSDGKPLTVEDVVFSLERSFDPRTSAVSYFIPGIRSIRASGSNQVTMRLEEPVPYGLAALASYPGFIFQKDAMQRLGAKAGSPEGIFPGTGPYVIERFVPGGKIEMRRNAEYWGKRPPAERVVLSMFADIAPLLLAARSGELDVMLFMSATEKTQLEGIDGLSLAENSIASVWQLAVNTSRPPLDDVNVRRALAYAMDRESIARGVFSGIADVTRSTVAKSQWGGVLDAAGIDALHETLPDYGFDLDKARAELARSAYADGLDLELEIPTAQPEQSQIGQIFAQNLSELGITLTLKQVSSDTWGTNLVAAEKPQMTLWDPTPDYPDPVNNVYATFYSEFAGEGGYNVSAYANAEVDDLLERQFREADPAGRATLIGDAIRLVVDDVAAIPIVEPRNINAVADGFALKSGPWSFLTPVFSQVTKTS